MSKKQSVIDKIIGVIMFVAGVLFCVIEYYVLVGIGAIGAAVASFIGVTGGAATGVVVIAYIPVIGLIIALLLLVAISFYGAWVMLFK